MKYQEHHLFQILRRFENQHLPLDLFLSHYFKSHKALGASDRRFIAETIYGMIRWKGLLDHLMGKQQGWEGRFALFKGLQTTEYLHIATIPLHVRVSFPENLFSCLHRQYGEKKAIEIATVTNTQAPITVRANSLKTTREALLACWNGTHQALPTPVSPLGIHFKKRLPFFEMREFKEGQFEVQDEASQLIALLVKAKPGDQVLDYCAGSGGKTLAFGPQLENKGQIYLHDIREIALEQARKRLNRAGIQNAQFLNATHPYLSKLKQKLDWVLVDAPCSGTGTLRRNPDMKWKFTFEMVERLVKEQREIFEKALSFVRPGGHITYATCSILQEENENQRAHFLKEFPLEVVEEFVSLPTLNGMDGFFGCTFKLLT